MSRTSDEARDRALDVLRQEYYDSVRATAEDLKNRAEKGEFPDADRMLESLEQAIDQCYWTIYYHAAYQCVQASNHENEAWEEVADYGFDINDLGREVICKVAYFAHRADVLAQLGDLEQYFEE